MIGEAKLSAIIVSLLTGIGLTIVLSQAFHSLTFALTFTIPITLVMGGVLTLFASDTVKKGRDPSPPSPDQTTKGN